MNEALDRLESLFAATLQKPEADRAVYLDQACADDPALRQRVEDLLRAQAAAGSFLAQPAPQCVAVGLVRQDGDAETQGELPDHVEGSEALNFLTPTDKPGVLGRLEHYDILEVIGRGGMGIVLRGFDEKLHRVVAIKVMAAQLAASGTARQRFRREAQAAAAVSHDHLVTIHAVEETNGLPYLVMQYVSGLSLQQRLDRDGPLQLAEIVRIGMQTASGLAAAHSQGLVHRDIKPANILLENGIERVKITDFGLARAATDASLTQSGVVAGTPQYMSPEQAEGKQLDQRSDLFSMGSVLYAMCTGRAPFRASGSMAVLKRVCEETPRPIQETNSDIPDWLVAIIDKLHAKAPADRYQTAAEVAELLNQHLAHLQHPSVVPLPALVSKPTTMSVRRERRSRKVLLAVGIMLALSLVALWIWAGSLLNQIFPSLEKTPLESGSQGDWVQLFNGKDLTGWKYHPKLPGNWTVKDGILTSGGPANYLYSERGDYRNFHLRAEVRFDDPKDVCAVIFRSPYGSVWTDAVGQPGWNGYAVVICGYPPGTLTMITDKFQQVLAPESLVQPGQWFTLEVIAQGGTMTAKIDGTTTATLVHSTPAYAKGHLAFQQLKPETKIEIRKIEIKELPPIVTAAQPDPQPFVVLGGKGVAERKFDTLAKAVKGASDGDTIEIRGNGPFTNDPVSLGNVGLTIRAADGFRPVLKLTDEAVEKGLPLLETSAPLVLEGLELHQVSQKMRGGGLHCMLLSHEAPLWIVNCRFFMKDHDQMCVRALACPTVELRNCEFFTNGMGLHWVVEESSKCLVSNCVQAGGLTLGVSADRPGAREASARLEHNTLTTSKWLVALGVGGRSSPKFWGLAPEDKLVRIKAADNILDAKWALAFLQHSDTVPKELWSTVKGPEAKGAFRSILHWDDERNVFAPGAAAVYWNEIEPPHGPAGVSDWKKFWGNLNADAREGPVRYQGGNLSAKLAAGPDKLTPEDFRLRPDSAGYKAGKDGKDLGADVDLVGPGPAYERWKKTPEYQQWLKDTKQVE